MAAVLQKIEELLDLTAALDEFAVALEGIDIAFANAVRDQLNMEITLHGGPQPSSPGVALIQAAPLGAFVPWTPLAFLPVPALEAGETHVLRLQAASPQPRTLGDPAKIPPHRLLTALGAEDEPKGPPAATAPLPNDIFALLGHDNPHWAGNLNVFVNNQAVERHMAQALRIYPGRRNLAIFVVGSGPDAYAFSLEGSGTAWNAGLHDLTGNSRISPPEPQCLIPLERWIPMNGMHVVMLSIRPPHGCGEGEVEVHVRQRSTGKKAVVEFTMDERGVGPGCFVV